MALREANEPTDVKRPFRRIQTHYGKGQDASAYNRGKRYIHLIDEFSLVAEEQIEGHIHDPDLAVATAFEKMVARIYREPTLLAEFKLQLGTLMDLAALYRKDVT